MDRGSGEDMVAGSALLLGDLDVAYPLRSAGIPVTVVRSRRDWTRFSRAGIGWVERPDDPADLAATLVRAARSMPGPVVLFVQDDEPLQYVSDHRDELAPSLRFLLPDADVLDALLDKWAFQQLAERHGLPVPETRVVSTDTRDVASLAGPTLVKPLRLRRSGTDVMNGSKAFVVADGEECLTLLRRLAPVHDRVLLQRLVPGPETRVESYHAYVDATGQVLAEFTGRKLRTVPAEFGYSTALITTLADDVRRLGRRVVGALNVRGFVKIDVKRGPDGRLWVLEVNPRTNLWHRLGAVAGCNLPVLAFHDLVGAPLVVAPPPTARPGVTWSRQPRDLFAAHDSGMSLRHYLPWLARCDAVTGLRLTDPWPFVRGGLLPHATRSLRSTLGRPS